MSVARSMPNLADSCAALKAGRAFSHLERHDGVDRAIRQSRAPLEKAEFDEHGDAHNRPPESLD